MNMSIIIELTGYLGSLLVVVSMLMSSIVKLRIINIIIILKFNLFDKKTLQF